MLVHIFHLYSLWNEQVIKFCASVGFSAGVFCVESFPLYEMREKLSNGADKYPIDGIEIGRAPNTFIIISTYIVGI